MAHTPACGVPLISSHRFELSSPVMMAAAAAQRVARTTLAAPGGQPGERRSGFGAVGEVVLPGSLLIERAEEALDCAVLLGRMRRDELLSETVVTGCGAKAAGRDDQAAIAPHGRRYALGKRSGAARQAGLLELPRGLTSAAAQSGLDNDDLVVAVVDDRRQVPSAVGAAVGVREVHRPAPANRGDANVASGDVHETSDAHRNDRAALRAPRRWALWAGRERPMPGHPACPVRQPCRAGR